MVVDSKKLKEALSKVIIDYLERRLPLRRISFVAGVLNLFNDEILLKESLVKRILSEQKSDGGWIDCEDSLWNLSLIPRKGLYQKEIHAAINWLKNEKSVYGAWGFCKRDYSCIPITSQALLLVSEIRDLESVSWLEEQWRKDLKCNVKLNYKAAWYLLVYNELHEIYDMDSGLFIDTYNYLITEQRNDGSWGPWKEHPAPSDEFMTGICIAALADTKRLSSNQLIDDCLNKSLKWISNRQLKDGLFPTHYIEEGSAWIYFALNKIQKCMESSEKL